MTEECQEAMVITASQVMQKHRGMLASLIIEVVAVSPEEEALTVHYLYYMLVLMKGSLPEWEGCLRQAQTVDQLYSGPS